MTDDVKSPKNPKAVKLLKVLDQPQNKKLSEVDENDLIAGPEALYVQPPPIPEAIQSPHDDPEYIARRAAYFAEKAATEKEIDLNDPTTVMVEVLGGGPMAKYRTASGITFLAPIRKEHPAAGAADVTTPARRKRGRPAGGKRSSDQWERFSVLIRSDTRRAVNIRRAVEDSNEDLSEFVDRLLNDWANGRGPK